MLADLAAGSYGVPSAVVAGLEVALDDALAAYALVGSHVDEARN